MFTTRGYRHSKRENKNKSRQGQIIQQKPTFTIDNNPVVLEAYKKFLFGSATPVRFQLLKNEFNCTLSEFDLQWEQTTPVNTVKEMLKTFADDMFNRYRALGKEPVALELYSPNYDDTLGFTVCSQAMSSIYQTFTATYNSILIFIGGSLSFTQSGTGCYYRPRAGTSLDSSNLTIGYGVMSDQTTRYYGNPTTMKVDIYFYEKVNGN